MPDPMDRIVFSNDSCVIEFQLDRNFISDFALFRKLEKILFRRVKQWQPWSHMFL